MECAALDNADNAPLCEHLQADWQTGIIVRGCECTVVIDSAPSGPLVAG